MSIHFDPMIVENVSFLNLLHLQKKTESLILTSRHVCQCSETTKLFLIRGHREKSVKMLSFVLGVRDLWGRYVLFNS